MLVRPLLVFVVVSFLALNVVPVPAGAIPLCIDQPWCTVGQCDPTNGDTRQCDREAGPVVVDCDELSCAPSLPSVASGRPPSDHFLDVITNVVYQQMGTELVPIGSALPQNGYATITISNHDGVCSTSGLAPCRVSGLCGAVETPEGLLCVEFNVQLVGCHSIHLVMDEVRARQVYPIQTSCKTNCLSDTSSIVNVQLPDEVDVMVGAAVECATGDNGVGTTLVVPSQGATTQAYFHQIMGADSTCYPTVQATLAVDMDTDVERNFDTVPIPYCGA